MTLAYPLQWPPERPRTPPHRREFSRFDVTPGRARQELVWECERMGGRYVVISTNVELRRDGLPYASAKAPEDPGVAVYFERKGETVCFSCDRYRQVWENMRAIGKTIEAMRGIDRWGAHEVLDQMFRGFVALPAPGSGQSAWWEVLGVPRDASAEVVREAYRRRAREAAAAGDHDLLQKINVARDDARRAAG